MIIYVLMLIALMMAFYNIGQNQIDNGADSGDIPYSTAIGVFDHVYTSSLGELSTETYYGDDQWPILFFLLIFMTFFMSIHLLNMLIAMMGESFTTNHEAGDAKKK